MKEDAEAKNDENQSQGTPEHDKTMLVNGCHDSAYTECQENGNITIISVDYDAASNADTSTVIQEKTTGVEECATEVVQVCDESANMFVVQEESTTFCSVEAVDEQHSSRSTESSMSDDVGSSVAFSGAVVQEFSGGSVSCAAELAQEDMQVCELVECTGSEDFQVATVDCDDNMSVYNLGSTENIAEMREIVMECREQIVEEEVPMNPVEKALIRRRYVTEFISIWCVGKV